MLLDNPAFADDDELLAMDKEDALIVFEDHIRELEKEEETERDKERKLVKRQQRKNRDAFTQVLDELHEGGKLTSMSLWVELYPHISSDIRFSTMLGQPGSTPLDLFKFYVEDLKSRFHSEKKIIREILKELKFDMTPKTSFDEFATVVCEDKRSSSLDAGNVKLAYNSLLEKAESREKERLRDEAKKAKRLETSFRSLLSDKFGEELTPETPWDDVVAKIEKESAFQAVTDEAERQRMFKDYQKDLEETCMHNHGNPKASYKKSKDKKKDKKSDRKERSSRSRKASVSPVHASDGSDSEGEIRSPKKRTGSSGSRRKSSTQKYSDFSDSSFGNHSDYDNDSRDRKASSGGGKKRKHAADKKNSSSGDKQRTKSKDSQVSNEGGGGMSAISDDEEYFNKNSKKNKKSKKSRSSRSRSPVVAAAAAVLAAATLPPLPLSAPPRSRSRSSSPPPPQLPPPLPPAPRPPAAAPASDPAATAEGQRSRSASIEEGELSEEELEQKRMALLKELQASNE